MVCCAPHLSLSCVTCTWMVCVCTCSTRFCAFVLKNATGGCAFCPGYPNVFDSTTALIFPDAGFSRPAARPWEDSSDKWSPLIIKIVRLFSGGWNIKKKIPTRLFPTVVMDQICICLVYGFAFRIKKKKIASACSKKQFRPINA